MIWTVVCTTMIFLGSHAVSPLKIRTTTSLPPPDPSQAALMARYVVHKAAWASLATISSRKNVTGYPYVTLKSLSDGPENNGTGVLFLYMTDMDVSGQDVLKDNRVTVMVSLAETDYCVRKNFDPQDPRCAKIIISGTLIKLQKGTEEYNFGQESLYQRHPAMRDWPKDHEFYVAKIEIQEICVLDFFGGLKYVTVEEYYRVKQNYLLETKDNAFDTIKVIMIEGSL